MVQVSDYSLTVQLVALCHLVGVSPRQLEVLLRQFDSVEKIIAATAENTVSPDGISAETAHRLQQAASKLSMAQAVVDGLKQRDIAIVHRFEELFPRLLYELNDPPSLLFVRGRLPDPGRRSIAIVGATHASSEGMALSAHLVREFVRSDIAIYSSLTGGIDTSVHLACTAAQGHSYALLDCGFDQIETEIAMPVAIDIVRNGGILSEYLPEQKPSTQTMEESNRLLVGLAQAVVVPEMYAASERVMDLVSFCRDIGKLLFFATDSEHGAHADKAAQHHAIKSGAIVLDGFKESDKIIQSLV